VLLAPVTCLQTPSSPQSNLIHVDQGL
jgi:hypothetical protein